MRTADQAGIRSLTIQKGQGFGSRRSLFSLSACNSYPVLDPGRLRPTGRLRHAGGIFATMSTGLGADRLNVGGLGALLAGVDHMTWNS
jgi:hypothetical protein